MQSGFSLTKLVSYPGAGESGLGDVSFQALTNSSSHRWLEKITIDNIML
jgi:hypothetical protein